MDEFDLLQRLALAIAIGAMIGVERHWRDRDAAKGQRTAGLRTFTLIGLLGGVSAMLEQLLSAGGPLPGLVLATAFAVLIGALTLFQYRESIAEGSFSVTTVVAAMLTFALGALAVLGDMTIASAGGVALLAVLASREYLHGAMRALTWNELRSAVILLALAFVALPMVPADPIGPFGGIAPARLLTVIVLLAGISFCGYVAVKLLGETRGELVAGAIGGIISSTATTITNARRSRDEPDDVDALAAGAIAAGAISLLRTAILIGTLAAILVPKLAPALVAGAGVMGGWALLLARRNTGHCRETTQRNPFDLMSVIKLALLLVGISFLVQAASLLFGDRGLLAVSGLAGLVDVDAATVTVTGLKDSLAPAVAAEAIGLAVAANIVAKAAYATALGSARFAAQLWLASLAAIAAAGAVAWFTCF